MRKLTRLVVASQTLTLPDAEASEEWEFAFRNRHVEVPQMQGGISVYGTGVPPKSMWRFNKAFEIHENTSQEVGDAVANISAVIGLGEGRLYSTLLDGVSEERWTRATADGFRYSHNSMNVLWLPFELDFIGPDPHWYESLTTAYLTSQSITPVTLSGSDFPDEDIHEFICGSWTFSSGSVAFTIPNAGNTDSYRVLMRLESLGTDGFTNPTLTNNSTGHSWESTRDGATSSTILQVNSWIPQVRYSINGGIAWTNDWASFTPSKSVWMKLMPGNNSMTFTSEGTVNCRLRVYWDHAYNYG